MLIDFELLLNMESIHEDTMALSFSRNLQRNYVPRIVCTDFRQKLGEQQHLTALIKDGCRK